MGGEVQVMADAHLALIAPKQEQWDLLLLVRYPSSAAFLSMLVDPDTRPPPFSAALKGLVRRRRSRPGRMPKQAARAR